MGTGGNDKQKVSRVWLLQVDDPLIQDANYEMDADDRS